MLQAGVARGVAVGVVDPLKAVEIDHEQRERLAATLRSGAFLGQPRQQIPAVADTSEIVEQRQIGDLVAQPIDRHQQEAEIERHRQEHQRQQHHPLHRIGLDERELDADMEQAAPGAEGIEADDENSDDAREPGAGVAVAVAPRQQKLQRQRERQRLAQRIDQDPHRHAVVADDKERQAGEA